MGGIEPGSPPYHHHCKGKFLAENVLYTNVFEAKQCEEEAFLEGQYYVKSTFLGFISYHNAIPSSKAYLECCLDYFMQV